MHLLRSSRLGNRDFMRGSPNVMHPPAYARSTRKQPVGLYRGAGRLPRVRYHTRASGQTAIPGEEDPFASLEDAEDEDGADDRPWGRYMLASGLLDYYEILQVDDDASAAEVKRAYRSLAKECHPDYLGDRGHNLCIVVNEAYAVLSDPTLRTDYNTRLTQALKDEADDFTGRPLSKWVPSMRPDMAKNENPAERRAVFVDEFTCIGCKMCVWCASSTFRIEPTHGRSRVFAQWLDPEESLQTAIESCPVSCIHWVDRDELPALEFVTQKKVTQRVNVANMMAGNMGGNTDAFSATAAFMRVRQRQAEAAEAARRSGSCFYSPAQEAARRSATEDLRRQQQDWFSRVSDLFSGTAPRRTGTEGDDDGAQREVGRRKRVVRWDAPEREAAAAAAASASRSRPSFSVPPGLQKPRDPEP